MSPRIPPNVVEPLLFAHRGAGAEHPDNTIGAFRAALVAVNGLESDVRLTADGIAVLAHDDVFGRVLGRKRVSRSTRSQLPGHIPTVAELFDEVGTDFALSLDLKDPRAIDATVDAVRRASDRTGDNMMARTWCCHPDVVVIAEWRERYPDLRIVHSTRLERLGGGPERHASELFERGIDAVNFRAPDWTGGLTTLYHKFGLHCFGWDAHLTRVAVELLDMGCDGVYGNHVDRLVDARRTVWGW